METFHQPGLALAPCPERCPSCDHRLTPERVCWHCCDRLCRDCAGLTGSAFVDICWSCWFKRERLAKMLG